MAMVERPAVERSTVHRIWRALLVVAVLAIAVACYVWPVVAIVIGVLLVRSRGLVDRLGGIGSRWSRALPLASAVIVTALGVGIMLSGLTTYLG